MAGTADLDQINEYSTDHGVWIDGVLLKDGYVSGRSLGSDSVKLDGIEAGADVTDSANVSTAGAIVSHSNMNASAAPTVNDDSDDGYAVASRWFDTTNDKEYVCLDVTVGAAVWIETTSGDGSGLWQSATSITELITAEDVDMQQKELISAAVETLTTTEREALSPVDSQMCFDTDTDHFYIYVA